MKWELIVLMIEKDINFFIISILNTPLKFMRNTFDLTETLRLVYYSTFIGIIRNFR